MKSASTGSKTCLWHRSVLVAGFIFVACFYAWTNGPKAASWHIGGQQSDHYNSLMHGFLQGHLYMDAPVADELKACPDPWNPAVRGPDCPILQDATYYNGHYYLYYGVAPLVTLMLPFRLVTGADMPLSLATLCFAWAGLLVSLILWESIRERYFPEVRAWVGLCAVVLLGLANPLPVLLRRTLVYELPIASAYFYSMAALFALYRSLHSQRSRIAWLAVASVCMGLAVASRLTFLFAMPILLIPVAIAWHEQETRQWSDLPVRMLIAAVAPIAAIGAALAVYNYQRYGQLGEFGTSYQVAQVFYLAKMRNFAVVHFPFNLFDYFLATPDLCRHFPYFLFPGVWHWPIHPEPDYWGPELVPGMLVCFPVCGLAALSFFAATPKTDSQRRRLGGWLLSAWGLFVGTTLCLLCFHAGTIRYMVDFALSLMLCAAVGLLVLERWLIQKRSIAVTVVGRATWLGLLTASLLVAVMFSLDVQGTFRAVDPVGHARVAKFFENLSFWNTRLPDRGGPVEVAFRCEKIPVGQSEPLLACGAGQLSDSVFLRWPEGDRVVVGYRRGLDAQPQLSAPIAVHAGEVHKIYLDLGSLYAESPDEAIADKSGTIVSHDNLKKRWMIVVDDKIVLQGSYNDDKSHAAGDLVFLGCNPNSDDFGKKFVTRIVSARRLPLAEAATRAANRSSMSLEFKAPRNAVHGSETLLAVVGTDASVRVDIEYLSEGRAALKFSPEANTAAPNAIFPNNGQWHRLDLDQVFDGGENTIQVRIDRSPLTTLPGGRIDLRRDELRAGWAPSPTAAFTGLVRNSFSDSLQSPKMAPRGRRTAMLVTFPHQRKDVSEPLLVTGRNGAGDLYEVVYLEQDQLCFRQDHWGAGIVRTSRPIKVNLDVPHRIVFEFVQLQDGNAQPNGSARYGVLNMEIDGQRVWEKDAPYHAFKENEAYVGSNEIGGSSCNREFSGEIISCDPNYCPGSPE